MKALAIDLGGTHAVRSWTIARFSPTKWSAPTARKD
jgi:hypothetical protein